MCSPNYIKKAQEPWVAHLRMPTPKVREQYHSANQLEKPALLCVHSSFAIILKRKRKLVALLLLSYRCIVTINVLWLFFTVPLVDLQHVIVVFYDRTHFLNNETFEKEKP